MNETRLLGNLGADGELRYTQKGTAMLRLRLATEESYQDDSGQWQSRPEWHTVVVWGKRGEATAARCKKGRPVFVAGRLRTRKWTTDSGEERYSTEVVAKQLTVFSGYAPRDAAAAPPMEADDERGTDELGDDIPF
jgi:single-strand DNA-binding protein